MGVFFRRGLYNVWNDVATGTKVLGENTVLTEVLFPEAKGISAHFP